VCFTLFYLVYSDLLISTSVVKVQYACIDGLLDAAREFFGGRPLAHVYPDTSWLLMTVLPMSCPKIHERNDQAQMLESISLAADPVMIQCRSSGRHGPKGQDRRLPLETQGGDQWRR
jgi:hypothetical protein